VSALKILAIGFAALLGAWLVYLLAMQLDVAGLWEFRQEVRLQSNRWLLPVRLGVYGWAVWHLPRRFGIEGIQLKQVRMTALALAVFVELVAVQRLFLF